MDSPASSPSTVSPGRRARSASRTNRSVALSASVTTSVTVLFVATPDTPCSRRSWTSCAAARTTSTATASRPRSTPVMGTSVRSRRPYHPRRTYGLGHGGHGARDEGRQRRYNSRCPRATARGPEHPRFPATAGESTTDVPPPGWWSGHPPVGGRTVSALPLPDGRARFRPGRSFVTEARQAGTPDVRALTDALLARAAGSGGQLRSTEFARAVEDAEVTPSQAKKLLRTLAEAGVSVVVDDSEPSPPGGRRPLRDPGVAGHDREGDPQAGRTG